MSHLTRCIPARRETIIGGAGQYSGRPQSGALGVRWQTLLYASGSSAGIRTAPGIVARVRAHDLPSRVEDLELHGAGCVGGQVVVDDRAGRRILARRQLGRPRRRDRSWPSARAPRSRGLNRYASARGLRLGVLPERRHVVEDPEPAAVRARDEVGAQAGAVVLHLRGRAPRSPACSAAATASGRRRRTTPTPASRSRRRAAPSCAGPRGSN